MSHVPICIHHWNANLLHNKKKKTKRNSSKQQATAISILLAGLLLYFTLVGDWKLSKERDSNRWATVSRQNCCSHNVQLRCGGKLQHRITSEHPFHFSFVSFSLGRPSRSSPHTLHKAHLLSDSSYINVCCCGWRRSRFQPLKKRGKEWWWLKVKGKVTGCWDSGSCFVFFLTDPAACVAVLVVRVGPDFDESTVAGGIGLISQTAASCEGEGVWKRRECMFWAMLCSAACNYALPHRTCKHQVNPLQKYGNSDN